jgi:hypothetical protein
MGLTLWKATIAESLSGQGYATEERFPATQGFDEWYGIPRTYDEALWPSLNRTTGMWPSIATNKVGTQASSARRTSTKLKRVRKPAWSGSWISIAGEPWKRRLQAAPWLGEVSPTDAPCQRTCLWCECDAIR